MASRPGSPMPTRRRLNLLVAELLDDRAQTVVAAGAAALAKPELAERQGEVVAHHQDLRQGRMLAGQHLAHRQPRLVHKRERLDEQQIEPGVAALDDRGGVAGPALARPTGPVGQSVQDHPADVVAGLFVLCAGVSEANDDLHHCSNVGRRAIARHAKLALGPNPEDLGGPDGMVSADGYLADSRPTGADSRGGLEGRARLG